jgi:hypothetical protein
MRPLYRELPMVLPNALNCEMIEQTCAICQSVPERVASIEAPLERRR